MIHREAAPPPAAPAATRVDGSLGKSSSRVALLAANRKPQHLSQPLPLTQLSLLLQLPLPSFQLPLPSFQLPAQLTLAGRRQRLQARGTAWQPRPLLLVGMLRRLPSAGALRPALAGRDTERPLPRRLLFPAAEVSRHGLRLAP